MIIAIALFLTRKRFGTLFNNSDNKHFIKPIYLNKEFTMKTKNIPSPDKVIKAIKQRNDRGLKKLILKEKRAGYDINRTITEQFASRYFLTTYLHIAALNGSVKSLKILLEQGAVPDSFDEDSNTPLCNAASYRRVKNIKVLLEHGADPNYENRFGDSPLSKLFGNFADIALNDYPIHELSCCRGKKMSRVRIGNVLVLMPCEECVEFDQMRAKGLKRISKATRLFLDYGADPLASGQKGTTPLDMIKEYYLNTEVGQFFLLYRSYS